MYMRKYLLVAALIGASGVALAQDKAQFGRPATPEEVESWSITVAPDGVGLPHGSETAKGGSALRLAGIKGTVGAKDTTEKTIGTFWPYATTIFDYVFTSMPYTETKSLTHDETYAVTAYLLYLNEIIGENDVIDAQTLPKIKMPNRDYFIEHIKE